MKYHKKAPAPDVDTIMPILIGVWRRFHKLPGPPDVLQTREFRSVVNSVKILQERFADGKTLIGQDYFQNRDLLGAYILYQWVVHYQEGLSIFGELPETPRRVLDICSGPAPLAFAALRHGASDVIATDQNETALQLGAEISGRYGLPLTIRKWNCLKSNLPLEGKFDLIILGHCLDELFPSTRQGWEEEQRTFLRNLIDHCLNPQGHLVLIDSSFGEANRRILHLRDTLVSDGVPVQAPCVWRGECPAWKSHTPCYAQREFEKPYLIKEIQRAASINLGSLKMSYLIMRNPASGWPDLADKRLYRVISPPVESFRGKRFYLCGTDGKKHLGSHLEQHPPESRAFEYLRRGELISVDGAIEKQQAMDIVEGTSVHIEAACGKPLPQYDTEE